MKDHRTRNVPQGRPTMAAKPSSPTRFRARRSEGIHEFWLDGLREALVTGGESALKALRYALADLSIRLSEGGACPSRPARVTHQLESRMREIRTSGSEGGVGLIPHPYLYLQEDQLPRRPRSAVHARLAPTTGEGTGSLAVHSEVVVGNGRSKTVGGLLARPKPKPRQVGLCCRAAPFKPAGLQSRLRGTGVAPGLKDFPEQPAPPPPAQRI